MTPPRIFSKVIVIRIGCAGPSDDADRDVTINKKFFSLLSIIRSCCGYVYWGSAYLCICKQVVKISGVSQGKRND
jgi:hypothetical protein